MWLSNKPLEMSLNDEIGLDNLGLTENPKTFGDHIKTSETPRNSIDLTYTVDDAVNKAGYGKFQIRLLILAGIGWSADACEIFILSVIGSFIACDWPLMTWQIALLTSVVFAGIAVGAPVLGTIADVYGRKKSLVLSVVMLFVFGVVSGTSPSYWWLVVFRAIMGFAVGGISQGLTLCTEYCPTHMRGRAGLYLCYFWSIGTVGVILMAWVVMSQIGNWRILLVIAAMPSLVVCLSLKWYPESARYYLVSDQYDKAVKILKKVASDNGTELPSGRLAESTGKEKRGRLKDMFSEEYRLSTLLFWYIWLATAFSYYGIALVSPFIIQQGNLWKIPVEKDNFTWDETTDMNYEVKCETFTQQNYIDLLWTSCAEFPGLVLFTILVERVRRKVLLSVSCFISSILLVLLLLKTHKTVILLLLFAARGILLAVFQLIFVVTSETYPTTFRAMAIGFGSSFCRIGGLIVPYVSQVLIVKSPLAAMCLMSGVIFFSGVAAAFLPFETRGATMKDSSDSRLAVT